jgi:hypothetical protein
MARVPWYQGRLWHGMGLRAWLRLVARNRCAIQPRRLPLALGITAAAALNSMLGCVVRGTYGRRIAGARLPPDPVFIIGHWRTGTTMLHELLALDTDNRSPTTYESLSPHHFLLTAGVARRGLRFMLPRTRPMDGMRVGFERPQEDEIALALLGAPSSFLSLAFPNRPPQHPGSPDLRSLSPAERAAWERTLKWFLAALLVARPGRLVLKSPQHTFRIRELLEMFPQARFIHLVRDPAVVFPSTVHFWSRMAEIHALQEPTFAGLEEDVLTTFAALHRRLEETRPLVPPERFLELRYEDLVADPVATVRGIYDRFGWPGFERIEPAVRGYADRGRRYRPNRHSLTPDQARTLAARWGEIFERQGYRLPECP